LKELSCQAFILERCSFVEAAEIIVTAPVKRPAPPIPATARPIMKAVEEGATPQIREPSSKMEMKVKKVI
jgi:hypothetical protein